MTKILLVIGCAVLLAACDGAVRMSPLAPTPVVPVATAPPPAPVPPPPTTELIIGSTIQRKVDESSNPDCPEIYLDLGCQYFRITPDRDGMLDIELTWVLETQPRQPLDLSLVVATGQLWATYYPPAKGGIASRVRAGETVQITVWYTMPGVEFSLRALLQPN